ncbi:MAG: RidA family protein [Candidatus Binataceae bacterium]
MNKQFVNPSNLFTPTGYTHSVTVEGAGKLVFISGQVARDRDGRLIKGDLPAQARQASRNLVTVLAAAGASPADVVKLTTYVAGMKPEDRGTILAIRNEFFDAARLPASTLIGVAGLAEAGMLVEIEAIAVVK